MSDVPGASRVEHRISLDSHRLGTHELRLTVVATSPQAANPNYEELIRYTVAGPGDANLDGLFNRGDLVGVLAAGEYEDGILGNSGWGTGDWDADLEFTSGDLILALQNGGYELGSGEPTASVPQPSGYRLVAIGMSLVYFRSR